MTVGISNAYSLDSETFTIRFDREMDATPAEVFDSWTRPEEVSMWWDPDGEPLVACTIDLRVGGSFSFSTRQHSEMPFSGTYREITRPHRLVFEAMGAIGRVALTEAEHGTRMVVEIVCSSAEQMQMFAQIGVAAGTARTLDNLVAYLGRRGIKKRS